MKVYDMHLLSFSLPSFVYRNMQSLVTLGCICMICSLGSHFVSELETLWLGPSYLAEAFSHGLLFWASAYQSHPHCISFSAGLKVQRTRVTLLHSLQTTPVANHFQLNINPVLGLSYSLLSCLLPPFQSTLGTWEEGLSLADLVPSGAPLLTGIRVRLPAPTQFISLWAPSFQSCCSYTMHKRCLFSP